MLAAPDRPASARSRCSRRRTATTQLLGAGRRPGPHLGPRRPRSSHRSPAAVTSLQYLDQRIRKEAYDVELMPRRGSPRRDSRWLRRPLGRPAARARRRTRHGPGCGASCCSPEYHEQNLVQRLLDLARATDRPRAGSRRAGAAAVDVRRDAGLPAAARLALVWLLSRTRRTRRRPRRVGPVLDDDVVTAAELRARAEAALADGGRAEALVDGFRALAVRQVERGRLEDPRAPRRTRWRWPWPRQYPAARPARRGQRPAVRRWCSTATGRPRREQATGVLRARRRAGGRADERGHRDRRRSTRDAPSWCGLRGPPPCRAGHRRWDAVAALAVVVLLGERRPDRRRRIDPDNPGPTAPGPRAGARRRGRRRQRRPRRRRRWRRPTSTRRHHRGRHLDRATSARPRRGGCSPTPTAHRLVLVDPGPGLVEALGTCEPPSRAALGRRPGRAAAPTRLFADLAVRGRPRAGLPGRRAASPATDGSWSWRARRRSDAARRRRRPLTNDQVLRADNAAVAAAAARPARPAGLVRPHARRPRRPTTASASQTLLPALARARPVAASRSPCIALVRVAGPPARAAGHRAAAGRREGDRDHPEPAAGSTAGPATGPRRRGAAAGDPRRGRRRGCGLAGARRRRPRPRGGPAHRPRRGRGGRAAGAAAHRPPTDHALITLARALAELDREVRRT